VRNTAEFEAFLSDEVNLNQHRIDTLTGRVATISQFLMASIWGPIIQQIIPQGSWAHRTIIKPPGEKGFDADLLVFVAPVPGWSASDYVLNLREILKGSATYREMVGLRTRCVTLTYANDFELDIVPCVVNRPGGTHTYEVCNRTDNTFEPTDSLAYTRWFTQRNEWVGNDQLRCVVRLLKYLRDIKLTFSCKSILLTTLVANHVDIGRPDLFSDLPTSLKTLINRLDDYLQARPALHDVKNPVLPAEDFVRHWDADKYTTFREMIHTYRSWIDEAYSEPDVAKSQDKWQRVFGDEFGGGKRLIVAKLTEAEVSSGAIGLPYRDAVEAVKQFGVAVLGRVKASLPWVKAPPWRRAPSMGVLVSASAHHGKDGPLQTQVVSGQVLSTGLNLRFEAIGLNGFRYGANDKLFNVQWQVVNTDTVARSAGGLRGGFYNSDAPGVRWEITKYHGVHWVQAFIIRRRDKACVGSSDRFFVVIE
jgi:hypothetical protein